MDLDKQLHLKATDLAKESLAAAQDEFKAIMANPAAQLDPGLRGLAVALKDRKGECLGAVSTTMPMHPITREQMVERFLPMLQECAQALRPLL